jgi:two-component system NarL family sensor kinase
LSTASTARQRWTVARQVGLFALAGFVAVVLVGIATAIASRRVGEREAIADARTSTLAKAQGGVAPAITDALLTRDPAAVARVDRAVRRLVLDASLVRVKIWTRNGTIVYSDEPRLIGSRYSLGAAERASIDSGQIDAEVSDLSKPENRYERRSGKLLEVYLPIRTPGGEPVLFEAYFRYSAVLASGAGLWDSFAPIALGALVLLELVQLPLAWSLARRLSKRVREREALLQRALDASDVERRQIASDLHDSVVQDLAGVAYSLSAAARQGDANGQAVLLEDSAGAVRESIKALRSLLVEIYPPNLEEEGLEAALSELLIRTAGHGVTTELDVSALRDPLSPPVAAMVYRAAQEGLRNVRKHAHATNVVVRVSTDADRAVLEVQDDGQGFDTDTATGQAQDGHMGLKGIAGLASDTGGALQLRSVPGKGTTFRVEVPRS